MTTDPICVAVIGYGSSARTFHIPFVLSLPDLFQLHTIQQRPNSKSGPPASDSHPNVRIAPTFEAVFEGNNGDTANVLPPKSLVIITTANETHNDFAIRAMKAGHHVIVEKPAALSIEDAESLLKTSQELELVCSAYQNRRLDSDFLTLRALMSSPQSDPTEPSAIGQITLYESRFDRYRPFAKGGWREEVSPEKGGGMLWDLGAHLIDQALVLFGTPDKVTAFASSARGQLPENVDDDFIVHLHYPTSAPLPPDSEAPAPGTRIAGPRVTLGASCLSAHVDAEQPRFRVEGTRGSFEKRGTDPQENQLKAGWTPSSHAESFGIYGESETASLRLGRLTTSVRSAVNSSLSSAAVAAPSKGGPKQPKLVSSNIPMLPGKYIQFYQNVGQTIRDVEAARSQSSSEVTKALNQLFVKPEQVLLTTKCILLARQSAIEGKTLSWN